MPDSGYANGSEGRPRSEGQIGKTEDAAGEERGWREDGKRAGRDQICGVFGVDAV